MEPIPQAKETAAPTETAAPEQTPTPKEPPASKETAAQKERKARESIVSRLFGFARRKPKPPLGEKGFARTPKSAGPEDGEKSARITVPEQVIQVRTTPMGGADEAVGVIRDGFRELTSLLGNVRQRLEKGQDHAGEVTEQLHDLPDFLRAMPRIHEEQVRALGTLAEKVSQGGAAAQRAAEALGNIPGVLRE
ncbi:MAG: hypothetical protein ACE5JG_08025, partial [Planctomycetota bacterium]